MVLLTPFYEEILTYHEAGGFTANHGKYHYDYPDAFAPGNWNWCLAVTLFAPAVSSFYQTPAIGDFTEGFETRRAVAGGAIC